MNTAVFIDHKFYCSVQYLGVPRVGEYAYVSRLSPFLKIEEGFWARVDKVCWKDDEVILHVIKAELLEVN